MTSKEPDLPRGVQDMLGCVPLEKALSTTSGLGIVLRPREFQRIALIRLGKGRMADDLERAGLLFPKSEKTDEVPLSPDDFSSVLARFLLPYMEGRSALGPPIERRAMILLASSGGKEKKSSSHPTELLRKIGAAYNGYRQSMLHMVANAQPLIERATDTRETELRKVASVVPEELITPLSFSYLSQAFMDELPVGGTDGVVVDV